MKYIRKFLNQNNVGMGQVPATNGITIVALVITIVLMLILASVTVNVVINGGLFEYTGEAKESTEIVSERQTVQKASIVAKEQIKTGKVTVEQMQKAINNIAKENVATAIDNGDAIAVKFNNSERYYYVDNKGNVEGPVEIIFDNTPGALDGTGTEADPFIIMSIEDLVYFSKQVNEGTNQYSGKYVALGKTLDFNSDLSYINLNTTEYDEYLGGDGTTGLKEQLTNGLGFRPIGDTSRYYFRGSFNGNNNAIKNIKVNVQGYAGLFGFANCTIQNLGLDGNIISSTEMAGGIVAYSGTLKIFNCYVKGIVTSQTKTAGGIVGHLWGATVTIDGCQNFATITANYDGVGGIIGCVANSNAVIRNSSNLGTIIMKGSRSTSWSSRNSWFKS